MIILILLDTHLHTPMYFLLSSSLSWTWEIHLHDCPQGDFWFSLWRQVYLLHWIWGTELLLLDFSRCRKLLFAFKPNDSYVAICFPLHYPIYMNKRACVLKIIGSWIMASINTCAYPVYALHIYPTVDLGPSTISSVTSWRCWFWPALTPRLMSIQCL